MGRFNHDKNKGRGRGHKGHNTYKNNKQTSTNSSQRKGLHDYVYTLGKASADYDIITKFLILHIRKTYENGDDIGNALENMQEVTFTAPTLDISNNKDATINQRENKQFEMIFEAKLALYLKQEEMYRTNKGKAYAFIFGQCSKIMQAKIMERKDYDKSNRDPIVLLQVIKELSYSYQDTKYDMKIVTSAIKNFVNLKQKDEESLIDYTTRFKTARDVLKAQLGGEILLHKIVKADPDYTKGRTESERESNNKVVHKQYERWLAYLYLENCDKTKYGTLIHGLDSQQALGTNQYPTTLSKATEVLSNHKFDASYMESKKRRSRNNNNPERETTSNGNSGQEDGSEVKLSFANIEGKCYCCGKPGHKSPQCRMKDKILRKDWAINKIARNENIHVHSQKKGDDTINTSNTSNNTHVQEVSDISTDNTNDNSLWSFAQMGQQLSNLVPDSNVASTQNLKNMILLDNQSSEDLFGNKKLLTDIHTSDTTLNLNTNGGTISNKMKGTLPNYGTVWYNPSAITNIISFAKMKDKGYKITYDSDKEDAFIVHTNKGIIKFNRNDNNLYVMDPNEQPVYQLLETVEENSAFYTNRQIARAKAARSLYHALGTPTVGDYKAIIRMNAIKNCPITMEDIDIAETIYGPDIGSIKGKTVRNKPKPVVNDYIHIPKELITKHQDITLCIDTMFINEMPFLSTISRHLKYRTIQWLPARTATAYRSALDVIFRQYNKAQFRISTIHCDGEFRSIMDDIKDDLDIDMNYANAQEHVPEAERNNRVIKERIRSVYHRLPFQAIPKIMLKILAMECTNKLNFFPPKGGISKFYSPRMILTGNVLDYNKHCSTPFGTFVQAHNENNPTNTMAPRALDCIYLRPVYSQQGGHELLDLATKRIITRRRITVLPITPTIIRTVESMAQQDGMVGIKIRTKTGHVLYDSSWITGVDYDDDEDDFDYEPDENESAENESEDKNESENESENYDQVDPQEIAELLEDQQQQTTQQNMQNDDEETQQGQTEQTEQTIINPEQILEQQNEEIIFESESETEDEDENEKVQVRRSERVHHQVQRYDPTFDNNNQQHYNHLITQTVEKVEYNTDMAKIAALYMDNLNEISLQAEETGMSFLETYNLQKGLAKFGDKGRKAAHKEMKQLHDRVCFRPIDPNTMTDIERKRALESLIFLVEKKSGEIKARTCANGSTQRVWMGREESSSPTVSTTGLFISMAVDAKEKRHVATCDIPNAFIQTEMDQFDKDGQRFVMKIRGALVDMLIQIAPEIYKDHMTYEKGQKIIYVQVLKAIYGMLQSALLFYKKIRNDLIENGFEINPYDPCIANKTVNGYQLTVAWHVDDMKASHKNKEIVCKFVEWLKRKYGKIGEVKVVYGNEHVYLGMDVDFSIDGCVKIDMRKYVNEMLEEFPEKVKGKSMTPANEKLFRVNEKSMRLSKEKSDTFHTMVAKALFLSKRARPDVLTTVAFLCTRVREPTVDDWYKLVRLVDYLKRTKEDCLLINMDNSGTIKWYVDVAYAVHPDMRSHTGAVMTLGKGAIASISSKQKTNARSSTEAELIGIDDVISQVLWTKLFMEHQGIEIKQNIIFQDNKSTILLAENGRHSTGKRSRHLNIKYFYITNQLEKKEMEIKYCPTDDMIGDYNTKPLQGGKFRKFKYIIMNN